MMTDGLTSSAHHRFSLLRTIVRESKHTRTIKITFMAKRQNESWTRRRSIFISFLWFVVVRREIFPFFYQTRQSETVCCKRKIDKEKSLDYSFVNWIVIGIYSYAPVYIHTRLSLSLSVCRKRHNWPLLFGGRSVVAACCYRTQGFLHHLFSEGNCRWSIGTRWKIIITFKKAGQQTLCS